MHGKNGADDVWTVQRRAAMDDAEYLSWQGEKMARAFGHALRAVLNERAADPLQSFSRHAVQFVEEPEVKQTTVRDESDAASAARAKAKEDAAVAATAPEQAQAAATAAAPHPPHLSPLTLPLAKKKKK